MKKLYKKAILKLEADWPARYRDICEKVKAVTDWMNPADAPDALIERMIYDTNNGVSSVGMAFSTWPTPRPAVGKYREMLQHLKDGLVAKYPSDRVAECRKEFKKITKDKGSDSIFNRIVSAFQPGVVSPVMFEHDFDDACAKLDKGGYIEKEEIKARIGDDPWHAKNVKLMNKLRELLPDGPCEDARWPIDDYTRGVFVWGVHADIDMGDWMILRGSAD